MTDSASDPAAVTRKGASPTDERIVDSHTICVLSNSDAPSRHRGRAQGTLSCASHVGSGPELGRALLAVPILGLLLLGAHLFRNGDVWAMAAVMVIVGLCCSRQGWARMVVAGVLFTASFLWVKAGIDFVQVRLMFGQDWIRLAAIMGAVTLFTFSGSVLLLTAKARKRFHSRMESALPQAIAFFLITLLLWVCREKTAQINLLLADRFMPGSGILEIVCVAVYGAIVCGLLLDRRKARKVRPFIWSLFSAVFFGQLILGLVGIQHMLMTGDLHLPIPALIIAGPLFRGGGYFMLILFAVSVLLVGPAWCSHLCYIGAWDDRMSRICKEIPKSLPRWVVSMRWMLAICVLSAAVVFRYAGMSMFSAAWVAAMFGLLGVAVMVFFSSRSGTMVHCSSYCPLGFLGNLLGRISPWRLRINDACTRCGACLRVCRYNALTSERLVKGSPALSCSLCLDCTAVCTHGAMEVTLPHVSPALSLRILVVLLASLHAVFLAVARM